MIGHKHRLYLGVCVLMLATFAGSRAVPMPKPQARRLSPLYDPDNVPGLYNSQDKLVILHDKNITALLDTPTAWVVEFYSSWCGHCINYAPKFKQFAKSVYAWRRVVQVGVMDCASEENTESCRKYEVMFFPTIKLFSAHSLPQYVGDPLPPSNKEPSDLRKALASFLQNEQLYGRGSEHWPHLNPLQQPHIQTVFETLPAEVKNLVLVAHPSNDSIPNYGPQLALDLLPYRNEFTVVWLDPANNTALAASLKIDRTTKWPSLLHIQNKGTSASVEVLNTSSFTVNDDSAPEPLTLLAAVKGWLKLRDVDEDEGKGDGLLTAGSEGPGPVPTRSPYSQEVVYVGDLERALQYALTQEIATHNNITGDSLQALKNYLRVLSKHFPAREAIKKLLSDLTHFVSTSPQPLTGVLVADYLRIVNDDYSPFAATPEEWKGCRGSTPKYRGYPCALWMTFHTLTVAAPPAEQALKAIHGYVKHFFSCEECSKNFQNMTARIGFPSTATAKEHVLWLWSAHNHVNKRLAGDASEDPLYPKIDFPSQASCTSCFSENARNYDGVYKYLRDMYGHDRVSFDGYSDDDLEAPQRGDNSGAMSTHSMVYALITFLLPMFVILV